MMRMSQSFLISLFFHGLIGAMLIYFFVPGMVKKHGESPRYCIALSQVLPAMPISKNPAPVPEKKVAPENKKALPVITAKKEKRVVHRESKPLTQPSVPKPIPATAPERVVQAAPASVQLAVEEETVPESARSETAPNVTAATAGTSMEIEGVQSEHDYLEAHLLAIAQLLKSHLYYPKIARKRGIEGDVVAVFTLEPDGAVHDVSIKQHARGILDRAAVETIQSLSGLLPHPKNALTLEVPIRFRLR